MRPGALSVQPTGDIMPQFEVSAQALVQYRFAVTADSPEAAREIVRAIERPQEYQFPLEVALNVYGCKQTGGRPTMVLHNVALTDEEELPNGYVLAREANGGGLRIHDRDFFHGYAQPWGDAFMIEWHDLAAGTWRKRRTFKTLRGAEQALRQIATNHKPLKRSE